MGSMTFFVQRSVVLSLRRAGAAAFPSPPASRGSHGAGTWPEGRPIHRSEARDQQQLRDAAGVSLCPSSSLFHRDSPKGTTAPPGSGSRRASSGTRRPGASWAPFPPAVSHGGGGGRAAGGSPEQAAPARTVLPRALREVTRPSRPQRHLRSNSGTSDPHSGHADSRSP